MNRDSPLGKKSEYTDQYSPGVLFAIERAGSRASQDIGSELPFRGSDIWNAWELTWLGNNGRPEAASAEIHVPAESPNIIESKSLKLYLNSFSMSRFSSIERVTQSIAADLGACVGSRVDVRLRPVEDTEGQTTESLPGTCIDALNIQCDTWDVEPRFLSANANRTVSEALHSHLLRSLCPVTGQPDTGSVLIDYRGPEIDQAGLLRYIVSFRQHNDFHEACVERMFLDISRQCAPEALTVCARYQRRGGIDINPCRTTTDQPPVNPRLWRQ